MNNELALNNMNGLENMSQQELDLLQSKIMNRKMQMIAQELAEVRDEQEKLREEMRIKDEEEKLARELEIKRHRQTESIFGYVSQSDLGQRFNTSIGSKTMGKLLRIVGIAKEKQSVTEPKRNCILNGTAKSIMYGDKVTYQWNPQKCIDKIDKWLQENGYILNFYSISEEKELMKYINKLAEKYKV